MNFVGQGFRKLSSDRQTDIQTDTTENVYHAASRVVDKFVNTIFHKPLVGNSPKLQSDAVGDKDEVKRSKAKVTTRASDAVETHSENCEGDTLKRLDQRQPFWRVHYQSTVRRGRSSSLASASLGDMVVMA